MRIGWFDKLSIGLTFGVCAVTPAPGESSGTLRSAGAAGGSRSATAAWAVLGTTVYFVTTDCNLVALDINTGAEKWAREFCSLEMMSGRGARCARGGVAEAARRDHVRMNVQAQRAL